MSSNVSWFDSISVFESDYVPDTFDAGPSVESNHELLSAWRENDFEITNESYTYGLLTLALVFLGAGVLACILVPCLYKCVGKSRLERLEERLRFGRQRHVKGNILMVVASVAAVAAAIGGVWGLAKADSGLSNIESHTQDLATDLLAVLRLPNDTSNALGELSSSYSLLQESVDVCAAGQILSLLLDQVDFNGFVSNAQGELQDLDSESLSALATDVQDVSDAVGETEGARKGLVWPVLILALLFTIVFVVVGVGTYELVACGRRDCGAISCCVTPCTIAVAVIVWLCAAVAVTLSALSGDFCIDPDTHTETLVNDNAEGEVAALITYYTGDCSTENDVADAVISAQEVVVPAIQSFLPTLFDLADQCDDLVAPVQSINSSMESLWIVLEDGAELSSCENINGKYQAAVYNELCDELPKGLLGFWVSCTILTILLLILVVQWNRMLRQQTTEEEASQILASRSRASRIRMSLSKRFSRGGAKAAAAPSSDSGVANSQRPVVIDRPQHSNQR
ncbi:unnamed protein product [Pylaiella littoralis]